MRSLLRLLPALSLAALLAACHGSSKGHASKGAAPPSSAAPARITGKAKLQIGTPVRICYRARAANPFAANNTDYTCNARLKATKSPLPDEAGAVTGAQVFAALRQATGKHELGELWARSVAAGADPKAPGSSIQVSDSSSEYYGNYVAATNAGAEMFVELAPSGD